MCGAAARHGGDVAKSPAHATVDEYIASFPHDVRTKLEQLRRLVRQAAPGVRETISYQMPTFYLNGNLVYFAAYAKHIGLYPIPGKFKPEMVRYKTGKGSAQFPLDEPLPLELIRRIVEYRVEENRKKKTKQLLANQHPSERRSRKRPARPAR
jgi:uncharacterized protein YdhG (YjbR/CyaY superfamily)